VKEAAALFELWMKDRALHSRKIFLLKPWISRLIPISLAVANDELFLAKYSEASGNPKNFVWNGLFSTLTT
jgi:small subunit ribosomal protein S29